MDLLQKRLPRQISYVLGEEESGEGGGEGGGKTNRKKWKTQKYKHPKNRKHKKTGKPTEEEEEEEEDCSSTACNKRKLALPWWCLHVWYAIHQMCIKIWCWSFYTLTLLLSFLWHLRFFFFWGSCIRNKMKNKKIRQREICWKMVAASSSSSSSSCIQFQLGVQIIFITFFTKHCWHSLFAMGGFLMTWACLQKRTKTLFGAVVVVLVMMSLGFPMMVVVQRIYMQVVRTGWLPEKNGNKRIANSIYYAGGYGLNA